MIKVQNFTNFINYIIATMIRFLEFLKEKDTGLGDMGGDQPEDEALLKALKRALSTHQEKVMQFLNTLAENDDEIRKMISKYKDSRNSYPPEHLRLGKPEDKEKDILAMPQSDANEPV